MLGLGERLKEVAAKVEDRLQEKSRSLQSHLQETFEVGGEKTAVQVELEKWQKEAEGILLEEEEIGTLTEEHMPMAKTTQGGKKEAGSVLWGGERTKESPFERRRDEEEDAPPPPGSFSLDGDIEKVALRELSQDPLFMDEGAMAMAAAALKDVGRKSAGLHSDEEASIYDKVIHMQRRQLEELRREKMSFEKEKASMQTQLRHLQTSKEPQQAPTASAAAPRTAEAGGGEDDGEVFHVRLRNPRRIAAVTFILVASFALFVRMQRKIDRSGAMDDATWTMEVQHAERKDAKLVGDLMRDKALLVKEKRNGTSTTSSKSMKRHLATVQRILEGMHKRHVNAKYSESSLAAKLTKENDALAKELKSLREQIKSLSGKNSTKTKSRR
ncbi:hypothetical protein GUITHDRAFT_117093 [Guillardia theta CCMP2712]|uniref:Transmembrane protein n=1 Tax=Guillardia theta (strain CCMP2712) TaxID=905079 RepID=L1IK94_GUITC|nr:hypothetical protein GUITHDRAFT_117093 [Guillardia theta CCMP2712]EKX36668.1 hypothetical protein GUITHDRAFT_117093 [Guillardia theta CCMP2712]|eukprot:XP_005823648.1 hypothetical protein GUITHDRAFT_117093 [Guillardia theta CCMP2712]